MRIVQLCSSFSILWHCLSLRLEWKLSFSSPGAIAEWSFYLALCLKEQYNENISNQQCLTGTVFFWIDITLQDVWLLVSDHIIMVIWVIKTFSYLRAYDGSYNSPGLKTQRSCHAHSQGPKWWAHALTCERVPVTHLEKRSEWIYSARTAPVGASN